MDGRSYLGTEAHIRHLLYWATVTANSELSAGGNNMTLLGVVFYFLLIFFKDSPSRGHVEKLV